MHGSVSGRPIMAALGLFSRRWILRIIWELRDQCVGFRDLQSRCDQMSPDTLSKRLKELKEAEIVHQNMEGCWELTPLGKELKPALQALSRWSDEWVDQLKTR